MRRGGWYGNSHGHALAARGVRLYAHKSPMMDPLFYAQKREMDVPYERVRDDVRAGMRYDMLLAKYPSADKEEVRKRGIRAIGGLSGDNTLSVIDSHGVDVSVRMAKVNPKLRERMQRALSSEQAKSFIAGPKVDALRRRLGEIS